MQLAQPQIERSATRSLVEFRLVPPPLVDQVFRAAPDAEEWLEEALARVGDFELCDLMPDLRTGQMQLWIGYRGSRVDVAVLTQIQNRPRKKVGILFALGGLNRKLWLHHLATIEAWMKTEGCERIDAFARPGLAQELPDYIKSHLWMTKALQ